MDGTINEVFIKHSSRVPFNREIQRGEDLAVTVELEDAIEAALNPLSEPTANEAVIHSDEDLNVGLIFPSSRRLESHRN